MKTLVIGTAFILAIGSFGAAAYGNTNGANPGICQSTPQARPTGGATRERLQAIAQCSKEFQSRSRQAPRAELMQQPNSSSLILLPTESRKNQGI